MVRPYIRTSLAPGSGMVTHYLNTSGVLPYFSQLGYTHTHTHLIFYILSFSPHEFCPCDESDIEINN